MKIKHPIAQRRYLKYRERQFEISRRFDDFLAYYQALRDAGFEAKATKYRARVTYNSPLGYAVEAHFIPKPSSEQIENFASQMLEGSIACGLSQVYFYLNPHVMMVRGNDARFVERSNDGINESTQENRKRCGYLDWVFTTDHLRIELPSTGQPIRLPKRLQNFISLKTDIQNREESNPDVAIDFETIKTAIKSFLEITQNILASGSFYRHLRDVPKNEWLERPWHV